MGQQAMIAFLSLCILCHVATRRPMMSEQHGKTYRPWDPERYRHEAQSPAAKLPEGDLVFFLLDTVPQLDVRRFYAPYETETRGAPPFDPAMMVCLLLYAYCVGVFASREIALACERYLNRCRRAPRRRPRAILPIPSCISCRQITRAGIIAVMRK